MKSFDSNAAVCRHAATAEVKPLTAHSRGRGKWDCVRQMEMYRHRPDVLAAALRDMGYSESGDEMPDDEALADGHQPHGSSSNN